MLQQLVNNAFWFIAIRSSFAPRLLEWSASLLFSVLTPEHNRMWRGGRAEAWHPISGPEITMAVSSLGSVGDQAAKKVFSLACFCLLVSHLCVLFAG